MKKLRSLFVAAAMLPTAFLTSCTPDVSEIQRITQQICGFIPTAVVVANFFPNPYTVPAATVAQAICSAVVTQNPLSARKISARLKSAAPVTAKVSVAGESFVVTGYFVR